jgi:hypothetical protein
VSEEHKRRVEPHNMNHFVYILQCSDASLGAVAEFERAIIGERVKAGL